MSYPVMDRDSKEWQEASRITNSIWEMAMDIEKNLFGAYDGQYSEKEIRKNWDTAFEIARTAIQTHQITTALFHLERAVEDSGSNN